MNRIVKTLLIWLLIAALPMQATAAVGKAACGSTHHAARMQDSSIAHAVAADVPHHDHMAMHEHADHVSVHGGTADGMSSIDKAADAKHSAGQAGHGHSTCSACASCCVGAAAPPSAVVKTPEFSAFIKSPLLSSRLLTGFIPAGLERPPRLFLA